MKLGDICTYRNEKIGAEKITPESYVSTESMLPNRSDIIAAASIPTSGKVNLYRQSDTLVSNIRPYFKKIWQASCNGCCSNDILVFRPKDNCNGDYLHWVLSNETFFDYVMATAKGTKMPRGDKAAIMQFSVPDFNADQQLKVASLLNPIQQKIELNAKLNGYLEEVLLAKAIELEGKTKNFSTVDDYCKRIYSGGTPSTKNASYWGGTLPWLSSGETRSRFIIDTEKTITPEGVEGSSTKFAHRGCIAMASAGQGFTRGQTSMLMLDTYVNQSVVVMEPKENCGSYLLSALAARYEELRAWSDSASTRGSMSGKVLKRFTLPRLTKNQLEQFEAFADPLIEQIETNLCESKSLAALRDILLPKLMSGEIDVSKVDLTQRNSHLA